MDERPREPDFRDGRPRQAGFSGFIGRQRKLAERARDVVRLIETQDVPEHVRAIVRCCADEAPELLSLGPVPATFAARILRGLCSADQSVRSAFLATVAEQARHPESPTIRRMREAGLLEADLSGSVDITPKGRAIVALLKEQGAIPP